MSWTTNQWTVKLELISWLNSIRSMATSFLAELVDNISKNSHANASAFNAQSMLLMICYYWCRRREKTMSKFISDFTSIGPAMLHSRYIINTFLTFFWYAAPINRPIWSFKTLQTHSISSKLSPKLSRTCVIERRREGFASTRTKCVVKIWLSLESLNGIIRYKTK